AREHEQVAIAERAQPLARGLRQTVVAIVVHHHPRPEAWNETPDLELETAVRYRGGEEQVALAELPRLAHIEQGELRAVLQPLRERGRIDRRGHGGSSGRGCCAMGREGTFDYRTVALRPCREGLPSQRTKEGFAVNVLVQY